MTLEVTKSWGAGVKKGDRITVAEVGGITTLATIKRGSGRAEPGSITSEDEQTKVQELIEGAPLAKVGDEAVYFLGKGEIGVVPGEYYVPLGTYQGKFNVTGGDAQRFVPKNAPAFPSLKMGVSVLDSEITAAPKKSE